MKPEILQQRQLLGELFAKLCDKHPDLLAQLVQQLSEVESTQSPFLPLEQVTRPAVDTAAAAYYLDRKQQTLRGWACLENGPLRPLRINGRLAWKVADIKRVLGVA